MSSVAARRSAGRPAGLALSLPRVGAGPAVTAGVAAVLAGLAFGAGGGGRLETATWAEVALILGGAVLAGAALVSCPRRDRPLHGGWTLLGLALLTAVTALSIVWSIAPAESWVEANRTFSYLAALAGALALVRLAPGRWAAVLHGVSLAAVVVCGWTLLVKCFPEAFAETEIFARLRAPFGYWNAVGLMAALGVPPLVWLAARRSGHQAANALAYPALGLLLVVLLLAYSRGALLALGIGLAAWLVVVPLRLRAATAVVVAGAGAAGVAAWAFGQDALTKDRIPLVARSDAGHELAILVVLMLVVLLGAGLAIGFATSRRAPSARTRRRAGAGLLAAVGAAAVAAVVALALAPGGIDGQLSKVWDPDARTPSNTPDRLTQTSSVRARYWDEAMKVFAEDRLVGRGAGAFGTARKRYRSGALDVAHAHGYPVQTLADLGIAGLLASLAALAAWLAAAARATGLRRRDRGLPWDAERVGVATLATVTLVFGIHSLIDWTWFVPATAVTGLLCAGWVAGRGPLRDRLGAALAPAPTPRPRLPLRARAAGAAALGAVAVVVAWAVVQPLRGENASEAAADRADRGALAAAVDITRIAEDRNPLSLEPLWERAVYLDAQGNRGDAHRALQAAARRQPASAEAWRRLGRFRFERLNDPLGAQRPLQIAYYLDPRNPVITSDLIEVIRVLGAQFAEQQRREQERKRRRRSP